MMGFIDSGCHRRPVVHVHHQGHRPLRQRLDPAEDQHGHRQQRQPQSEYAKDVLGDGATDFWRLGEGSGSTVYDYAGFNDATASAGVTRGATGAITGDADKASTFNGAADGIVATNSTQATTPSFTVESWVKTTSTSGGKIVGYGGSKDTDSGSYDRHVYMDNAGHMIFGVYPNDVRTVSSANTYNDGQ